MLELLLVRDGSEEIMKKLSDFISFYQINNLLQFSRKKSLLYRLILN